MLVEFGVKFESDRNSSVCFLMKFPKIPNDLWTIPVPFSTSGMVPQYMNLTCVLWIKKSNHLSSWNFWLLFFFIVLLFLFAMGKSPGITCRQCAFRSFCKYLILWKYINECIILIKPKHSTCCLFTYIHLGSLGVKCR